MTPINLEDWIALICFSSMFIIPIIGMIMFVFAVLGGLLYFLWPAFNYTPEEQSSVWDDEENDYEEEEPEWKHWDWNRIRKEHEETGRWPPII